MKGGMFMAQVQFAGLTYEQVVRKFHQTVTSVCIMRLQNWADAEDCFQNTFLNLYNKSPKFSDEEHLKAWLIRVSINECNNYIRKNKKIISLNEQIDYAVELPRDTADISWALLELEEKYRDVLYLYYVQKYKVSEIAQILRKNENTIKTTLKRGREKLKTIYGGDCDEKS